MRRQIKILLLSLWGAIALPILSVCPPESDTIRPMFSWLQNVLTCAMFWIHLVWILPAFGVAKILGIQSAYDIHIMISPLNVLGWILPIIVWFVILNILALMWGVIRKKVPTRGGTPLDTKQYE